MKKISLFRLIILTILISSNLYSQDSSSAQKNFADFAQLTEIEKKRDASHVEYEVVLPANYNSKNPFEKSLRRVQLSAGAQVMFISEHDDLL